MIRGGPIRVLTKLRTAANEPVGYRPELGSNPSRWPSPHLPRILGSMPNRGRPEARRLFMIPVQCTRAGKAVGIAVAFGQERRNDPPHPRQDQEVCSRGSRARVDFEIFLSSSSRSRSNPDSAQRHHASAPVARALTQPACTCLSWSHRLR